MLRFSENAESSGIEGIKAARESRFSSG